MSLGQKVEDMGIDGATIAVCTVWAVVFVSLVTIVTLVIVRG